MSPSLHYRTCHLCEAMCGVVVEVEGEKILSIRGDEQDPLSRGHICPKAIGLQDIHTDPDRLKRPLKRVGAGFEEVEWETAFEEIATRLKEIQAAHGTDAIAVYQGNPTVHNLGSMIFGQFFVKSLRTRRRFSATSVDQLPHMLASWSLFGHQLMLPVPDIDRTQYLLILGANPLVSNGSLMSAPDFARRMKDLQARGGKVVVVDPRRSETAAKADEHLFIRPGTDALLLLGMLNVLLSEGRVKLGHLEGVVEGLDVLRAACQDFSPEVVSGPTGIAAADITRLAREFAAAPSAVCHGRVGTCVQEFGGLCGWLLMVLNLVTGNLDREGGAMFTHPAVDVVNVTAKAHQKGHFAKYRSRVRGLPEFAGELPSSCLAEEIDTPGEGQLKALVVSCGNPVLSLPNGRRLEAALDQLELLVSVDIYLNETSRKAHYILPPTFGLEKSHYDLAFQVFAIRNTTKYSPALFQRSSDQRHDWEIYLELASRLEGEGPLGLVGRLKRSVGKVMGPEAVLDLGLRLGPYGAGLNPLGRGLTLKRLKEQIHGLDLGALTSCLPDRLFTADKKIQIAPTLYTQDLARLKQRWLLPQEDASALVLISRRELRSNNSWMHNVERLVKGKVRCTLRMHPVDAQARGLTGGQEVRIRSRVGALQVPLEVSDEVMEGVVSLPHGWGHGRQGARMQVAQAHPGASVNDLGDDARVDLLSGNAAFSGLPVTVEALSS